MTSYIDSLGTQTSSYNGDGLKASEGSTTLVWDGADYLGEVISGSFAKKVFTVSGRILGERSAAYGRLDYGLSPLGNVETSFSQGGIGTATSQQFKPYGEPINFYGAETMFRWVGAYGYRPTGYGFADYYVRARHYSTKSANWTTLDPLWPEEWGFVYVNGMPTTAVDPSGSELLSLTISSFINQAHPAVTSLGTLKVIDLSTLPLPGFLSSTDRLPFDKRGTNRGRVVLSIHSSGIGLGAPAFKSFIGTTTLYTVSGSTALIRRGHLHIDFASSGFEYCKLLWYRFKVRYCAALLPNWPGLCAQLQGTVVYQIIGKDLVGIELKDAEATEFPDVDSWVNVDSRTFNFLHKPATASFPQHIFYAMTLQHSIGSRKMTVKASTPPECGCDDKA